MDPLSEREDFDEFRLAAADGRGEPDPVISMPSPWRLTACLWGMLALLSGLALALAVYHQQKQRREVEQTFVRDELANKAYAALQTKLHSAESMLRAVQTLFLASDEVTATEFNSFYTNLRPREQFPSLLALAYAQREPGPDGWHYMTRWVEPIEGNGAVVGLDVGAQPNNLAGLLASRDSDRATLSAPFRPVQQLVAAAADDGITLRLPVFSPGIRREQSTSGGSACAVRLRCRSG